MGVILPRLSSLYHLLHDVVLRKNGKLSAPRSCRYARRTPASPSRRLMAQHQHSDLSYGTARPDWSAISRQRDNRDRVSFLLLLMNVCTMLQHSHSDPVS